MFIMSFTSIMQRRKKENEGERNIMIQGQRITLAKEFSELSGVKEIMWNDSFSTEFQAQIPFLYETAVNNGLEALKPWEKPEQFIPLIIAEWEKVKGELHKRFTNREKDGVPELMKKGLAFFYEILFWCNGKEAELTKEQLLQLTVKPINAIERLAFITSRPANYHSYVQLTELFIEFQKVFSKQQMMKKASKL